MDTGEAVVKCLKCGRKTATEISIDWDNPETCPRYMGEMA
jgi:hypothetical protein